MIPYDLIIPSASRPHLLERVLATFFRHADQLPARLIVHNDEVFPGRRAAIDAVLEPWREEVPILSQHHNPPIKHGPSLKWLLDLVTTPYCLYMQDDHQVVRDLPISHALALLDAFRLNQIRFNKRDTLDKKGREGEEFYKVEHGFTLGPLTHPGDRDYAHYTLCAADHWYFQCGVWRTSAIKPVVDWWMSPEGQHQGAFTEHCEVKINQVMNGQWNTVLAGSGALGPDVPQIADPALWNKPEIRARVHKTFIWGRIGEPRFVDHIGHLPEDWALERANRDPQTRQV